MTRKVNRICLISPGHLSTNPRLVKEARALKFAGYDVSVIHGRYKRWGTDNDAPIAEEIGAATAVSFGPIEASRMSYIRQSILRRGARTVLQAGSTNTTVVEMAHHPIVRDLIAAAIVQPADLYIAHYVAALPAAARAAQKHGALFAFDAEDFHLGDLPDHPMHDLERKIIRIIESRYLPMAAYVSAASPLIARAYAEAYGISLPTTILNVFPKENAPPAPTPSGTAEPGPSVYWFSQTIGPGRGLEAAIEAIATAQSKPHLFIRGSQTGHYTELLRAIAERKGCSKRLHFLDPAPPDELERFGARYDLGYVGEMAETRNRRIALTNKLFSFCMSGIPSLASDIPAHRALAAELGDAMILFPVNDPKALASAIDQFLLDPARLTQAREHAWRLGQDRFNWGVQEPSLLALIASVMAKNGVSALG